MKTFLFLVTALAMLAGSARSATIVLSGRIEGRLPGSILGDVNYHTLDFYWFRVPEATTVNFSHCTTNGPGGSWGTSLDLHVYPNADAQADLSSIGGIAGGGGFCNVGSIFLSPGNYIFDIKIGDSDYDGSGGLVPFSDSSKDFFWFDYQTTITGNLEMYESWIGQQDRTFVITSIPESGTGILLLSALGALLLRHRRMTLMVSKTPAIVLLLLLVASVAPVSAQQGVLEWPSREGMGYRLQRSGTLGGTQTPWINLPFEYYGTGGPVSHTCFQLEPPEPSTAANALQQIVPFRSVSAIVRKDGSAILRWTQNGVAVAKYVAPPPLGTSTADASAPPYFDFRTTPGVAFHPVTNRLQSGGPVLPAVAPSGQNPGYPYRLMVMMFGDWRPGDPVTPDLPPLTGAESARFQEYLSRVTAIRAAINNPAPASPPQLRHPFDAYGNPDRDFYRAQPRLVDSDGDGYSDSGEIQAGSDPNNDASQPTDTDGDGFSDAEELDADGDGITDSPPLYSATDANSHPPGGFLTPYLSLNDLVITEFMVNNDSALEQTVGNLPVHDDWVEIYNPTSAAISLNGYYLTDRANTPRKWALIGNAGQTLTSIGPRQFILVMADNRNGAVDAEGNGFLHASFGYSDTSNDDVIRLTKDTTGGNWATVSEYWIATRRDEQGNTNPPAAVVTPRDMFSRDDESYGTFAGANGQLVRGRLHQPTPGRHNSEGYAPTLPEPDFIEPVTLAPVPAGLRDAPPAGGIKVQISHPWNRDADPANDVVVLWTGNSAEPTEFSDIASGQAAAMAEDFSTGIGTGWAETDTISFPGYTAPDPHGSFTVANGEGVLQVTGNASFALIALRTVDLSPGDWRLQFRARSGGAARPLSFGISAPVPDDDPVTHSQTVTLGTTMQTYSVEFTQPTTAYEAQGIVFLDFRTATDSVILDDLIFYRKTSGGVVTLDGTKILRAFAVRDGWERSRVATRSYLFKSSILGTAAAGVEPTDHQGARDGEDKFLGLLRGYPELTEESTGNNEFGDDFWLLYNMHPGVISARKAPAEGLSLSEELNAVPVVSIVTDVASFFDRDAAGIYANSSKTDGQSGILDPLGTEWQRAASFEFMEPGMAGYSQTNTGLLITGGSSILQSTTRKHNLRVRFTGSNGEAELNYPVFGSSGVVNFKALHLKNPTHDAWSNTWSTNAGQLLHNGVTSGYKPADVATYSNDGWARSAHEAMGHVIPRQRWVHLFLNGIYWGPHQISERVDDDFMDSHFGPGSYDVLKQGPEALDGDTEEWQNMIALCMAVDTAVTDVQDAAEDKAAADAAYAADPSPANLAARDAAAAALISAEASLTGAYNSVDAVVDLENYIDYLIVNTYMANQDWCSSNWRAARNRAGGEWKFFIWDAEWSFRPGEQKDGLNGQGSADPHYFFGCSQQMDIANFLQRSQVFRDLYSERIEHHFFLDPNEAGSGTLAITGGVDGAVSLFEEEMGKFEPLLFSESARWGDMSKAVPFTKADSGYLAGKPYGDWERNTTYTTTVWLPERRTHFLTRMEQVFLYQP